MLKMEMCSRCHKRVAVVYISHIENGKTTSEGICLKCAKEIGITSVGDIMKKMGISDEDLDRVDDEMTEMFGQMEDGIVADNQFASLNLPCSEDYVACFHSSVCVLVSLPS